MPEPSSPIPVTLLTGFLGSGKTTLLNRLIGAYPRTAVVMNEFGEMALDHQLLRAMEGPVAVLAGGCVCCTVQGTLAPTLKNLHMAAAGGRIPPFERLVIETTGVAEPASILKTLLRDRWLALRFRLQSVVATVDTVLGARQLDRHPETLAQVAAADRVVLTKSDLAAPEALTGLAARVREINPGALLLTATHGDIEPGKVLDAVRFAGEGEGVKRWLGDMAPGEARSPVAVRCAPAHAEGLLAASVLWESPVAWPVLEAALARLVTLHPRHFLRIKGIVHLRGHEGPAAVHAVSELIYPPEALAAWPEGERRSRMVFITHGLEEGALKHLLDGFLASVRNGEEGMSAR